jgi:hypothetical protein
MKMTVKVKMNIGAYAGQDVELPNEFGSVLVYAGLATFTAEKPKPRAEGFAHWFVEGEGKHARICAFCSTCGQSEITYGVPKQFRHCGKTEKPVKEVIDWYNRASSIFA